MISGKKKGQPRKAGLFDSADNFSNLYIAAAIAASRLALHRQPLSTDRL